MTQSIKQKGQNESRKEREILRGKVGQKEPEREEERNPDKGKDKMEVTGERKRQE